MIQYQGMNFSQFPKNSRNNNCLTESTHTTDSVSIWISTNRLSTTMNSSPDDITPHHITSHHMMRPQVIGNEIQLSMQFNFICNCKTFTIWFSLTFVALSYYFSPKGPPAYTVEGEGATNWLISTVNAT